MLAAHPYEQPAYDVVELAAKFFEATLASRMGARARGYLASVADIEPRALPAPLPLEAGEGAELGERDARERHRVGQRPERVRGAATLPMCCVATGTRRRATTRRSSRPSP